MSTAGAAVIDAPPRRGQRVKIPPLTDDERDMVESNRGLVWTIAGRYFGNVPDADRDDLIGVGLIALARAVQRFDPSRGVKPSAYYGKCIHRQMMKAWDARHLIRIPCNSGAAPLPVGSLDAANGTDDDPAGRHPADLGDRPGEAEAYVELRRLVERALCQLTPKQAEVCRLVLIDGMRQSDAAALLDTSRAALNALYRDGRRTLRELLQGLRA